MKTNSQVSSHVVVNHLVATSIPVDDLLKRFWEIEETPADLILTQEEKSVLQQFETTHSRTPEGRFVVTLPRKQSFKPLGESRSQAVVPISRVFSASKNQVLSSQSSHPRVPRSRPRGGSS